MAEFVGIVLAHAIDPVTIIFVLLSFLMKKKRVIYLFVIGVAIGLLSGWLSKVSNGSADFMVRVMAAIIAVYIMYGLFSVVEKIRRLKGGHIVDEAKK